MRQHSEKNPGITWIFWFDESIRKADEYYGRETVKPEMISARAAKHTNLTGSNIIFAEHFPIAEKEQELFGRLKLDRPEVWSALDEPLFLHFGGEKIAALMKQLGLSETQFVEHTMISKAIINAQEKIASKVKFEQYASSVEEWLKKNI